MKAPEHLWQAAGVPRKGWWLIDVADLEEPIGVCQFCGKTDIRYLHTIQHDDYPGDVEVGCVCCEHLTNDYVRPRQREHELRLRVKRRLTFETSDRWKRTLKGNLTISWKGIRITVFARENGFKFVVGNTFSSQTYPAELAAKRAAFARLDR
jgi:hypothetical protein